MSIDSYLSEPLIDFRFPRVGPRGSLWTQPEFRLDDAAA